MTGAPSLAFPGSRRLAGWWRQLAPYRPQAVWVGHLLLHHVDALVRLSRPCRVDPLQLFLLKALAFSPPPHESPQQALQRLNNRLHLGQQAIRQILHELDAQGLIQGGPDRAWSLTLLGSHALDHREYPQVRHERRTFHFLDQQGTPGARHRLQFLDLHNSTGIPWPTAEGVEFDAHIFQACLNQPEEWKRQHNFPLDVQEVLVMEPELAEEQGPAQPPSWERVMVDRPERLLLVLLQCQGPEGRSQLRAFAVRQEGWLLQSSDPLFVLGPAWQETFSELMAEPPLEAWRQAWQVWCEPRGIPSSEVNACSLEHQGERLLIVTPAPLLERLRVTRSDALKGESWLLVGEGAIRPAVRIELVDGGKRGQTP